MGGDGKFTIAPGTLRAAMRGCTRCSALVRSHSRVVPGDGAVPAAVVFVGLAPAGVLLRRMIRRAGLTLLWRLFGDSGEELPEITLSCCGV